MKVFINTLKVGLLLATGFMLSVSNIEAQTVNTGDLYIMPGTQFSTVGAFDNASTGIFINDGETFIYNHFTNDGTVDYSNNGQGFTRFQGTAVQRLGGGNISYFYDVLFDNDISNEASFELSSEISIHNQAEFREGIVKNDDFGGLMIFENNASHIGAYNGSHVDGPVQKNGDNSFLYPIGDQRLFRYAAISAPDNGNDIFTGKYYFENPDEFYPLFNRTGVLEIVDNAEYWTITRDAGTSTVLVTLSWDASTTPDEITANPQENAIRIVRWDENENLWVDEGGIVDVENKTVTAPLAIEEYGVFTLGRIKEGIVLPGDVVVYNGISADGNGQNDFFRIDNIDTLENNMVEIYNRWGVKVFETTQYGKNDNVFRGYSDGRLTMGGDNLLPSGTYFYVLSYDYTQDGTTERIKQAGYLHLNGD